MGFEEAPTTPTTCNFAAPTIYRYRLFPSGLEHLIQIDGAAADLDFPDVVIANLPDGAVIDRVLAYLWFRAIKDTSTAANYIDAASKTLRVKKSTGSWGTDDLVAITFDNSSLYVAASTKEGGTLIMGSANLASEVDGNATYNFRSEQTNRADAISALADHIELYDVQTGLWLEFHV